MAERKNIYLSPATVSSQGHEPRLMMDIPELTVTRDPAFDMASAPVMFNPAVLDSEEGEARRLPVDRLHSIRNRTFALLLCEDAGLMHALFSPNNGSQPPSHDAFDRAIERFLSQPHLYQVLYGYYGTLPQLNRNVKADSGIKFYKYPPEILTGVDPTKHDRFLGRLFPEKIIGNNGHTQKLLHKLHAVRVDILRYKCTAAVQIEARILQRQVAQKSGSYYTHEGD